MGLSSEFSRCWHRVQIEASYLTASAIVESKALLSVGSSSISIKAPIFPEKSIFKWIENFSGMVYAPFPSVAGAALTRIATKGTPATFTLSG
jgi:hypothetical protein